MKLDKATTGDIVLSIFMPTGGLLIGLIALAKREHKRSFTMMAISGVIIALSVVWRLSENAQPPQVPVATGDHWRGATEHSENAQPSQVPVDTETPSMESQLLAAAKEVTRLAPQKIDADTRLDGAVAGPGLSFTYLLSLPNVASTEVAQGEFDANFAPNVRKSACGSAELKQFFDNNVTVHYVYRGHDGGEIGTVSLSRAICTIQ